MTSRILLIAASLSVILAAPAIAAGAEATKASSETAGLPVYPYDITDRPYKVLGEIKAGVRKATVFSKSPSQDKIYAELWERAKKLGADAVINAKYGDAHVTAMSWGSSSATGTAIKFLPPGEPAAPPAAK